MGRIGWLLLLFCSFRLQAQTDYSPYGKLYRLSSAYSMFPDSLRKVQSRVYQGKTYDVEAHYNDSTVLVFVPSYFNKHKTVQVVVYMHGWNNNVDSSLHQFKLIEQFCAARTNGILILPEGPKNAPDSYAGKFEQPIVFTSFIKDILGQCQQQQLIAISKPPPQLVLAGHSGAYKAIAKIIDNNEIQPKAILLFDALYAEEQTFLNYIKTTNSKLICVYTNDGGTMPNCKKMISTLEAEQLAHLSEEEDFITNSQLRKNKIIMLHSNKGHNDVLTNHSNFQRFLQSIR